MSDYHKIDVVFDKTVDGHGAGTVVRFDDIRTASSKLKSYSKHIRALYLDLQHHDIPAADLRTVLAAPMPKLKDLTICARPFARLLLPDATQPAFAFEDLLEGLRTWRSLERLSITHFLHVLNGQPTSTSYMPVSLPALRSFMLEDTPGGTRLLLSCLRISANTTAHIIVPGPAPDPCNSGTILSMLPSAAHSLRMLYEATHFTVEVSKDAGSVRVTSKLTESKDDPSGFTLEVRPQAQLGDGSPASAREQWMNGMVTLLPHVFRDLSKITSIHFVGSVWHVHKDSWHKMLQPFRNLSSFYLWDRSSSTGRGGIVPEGLFNALGEAEVYFHHYPAVCPDLKLFKLHGAIYSPDFMKKLGETMKWREVRGSRMTGVCLELHVALHISKPELQFAAQYIAKVVDSVTLQDLRTFDNYTAPRG